jgi:hypothetical protein
MAERAASHGSEMTTCRRPFASWHPPIPDHIHSPGRNRTAMRVLIVLKQNSEFSHRHQSAP